MKIIKDDKFILNGNVEKIIKKPTSREEQITITMGGMVEHATSMDLEHFEQITGLFLEGLEPKVDFNEHQLIENLKDHLKSNDFNIDESDYFDIASEIKFTNANNNEINCSLTLLKDKNHDYKIQIKKSNRYQSMGTKEFKGKNLPILIDDAKEQLKIYTSSKVQVISHEEENKNELARKQDSEGFNYLFKNESLTDYFKNQKMPAGIVINQKGRYQVFTSYMSHDNKQHLHHKTKDYANAKNAGKYLLNHGYSPFGKQLDVLDKDNLEESLRNIMSPNYYPSWSENETANFNLNNDGWINLSKIKTRNDDTYGTQYYFDWTFTLDETGDTYTKTIEIDPREGGSAHHLLGQLFNFTSDIKSFLNNEKELEFNMDLRTLDEKAEFHLSQINSYKERKLRQEKLLTNPHSEQFAESVRNDLAETNKKIALHLSKAQEIGTEMKEQEKKNGLLNQKTDYSM